MIHNGVDYHWYRQNSNGTWSHKTGDQKVTNLDASDGLIYDPETADRDYRDKGGGNYYDYIGFFEMCPRDASLETTSIDTEPSSENYDITALVDVSQSRTEWELIK